MNKELLYSLKSPFRDDFRIQGFHFGSGKKTVAVVGAMRGDEIQQQFVCSQLVNALMEIEDSGDIVDGHGILVIPSANNFAMNIGCTMAISRNCCRKTICLSSSPARPAFCTASTSRTMWCARTR